MAAAAAANSKVLRRLSRSLNLINNSRLLSSSSTILHQNKKLNHSILYKNNYNYNYNSRVIFSKHFCSQFEGPVPVDYSALLEEDEFHKLADATIHDLLEKIEEYGDSVDIDGFDIDYGNQVLTVKFGSLGTYVLNKQTPNRQIWMSSPVSGPSRFDWDRTTEAWIYRRTKAKLLETLENEIQQLCHEPIKLT